MYTHTHTHYPPPPHTHIYILPPRNPSHPTCSSHHIRCQALRYFLFSSRICTLKMIVIIIITGSSSKVPDLQANSINGQSISASPHRMQQAALTAAPPRRANTSARSLSPPGLKPLLMPLQGCIQTADLLAVIA